MMFCRIENMPVVLMDMEECFFLLEVEILDSGLIDVSSLLTVRALLLELICVPSVAASLVICEGDEEVVVVTGSSRFDKR